MRIELRGGRSIGAKRFGRWWKPWDVRGTITLSDLTGLHELTPKLARRVSDYDLHLIPRVRTNDDVLRSVIDAEMRCREGATARLALAVSFFSLIVSVLAFALKRAS